MKKIKWSDEMSLNDGEGLVIGRITLDDKEYSATYIVDAKGKIDLSDDDTDALPGDLGWPDPPKKYVKSAKALAKGTEGD